MKKVFSTLFLSFLVACGSEQGPAGPPGPPGSSGKQGAAATCPPGDITVVVPPATVGGTEDAGAPSGPVYPPRVFAYGNSLTAGAGVNQATDSYPAVLQRMLGKAWEAGDWLGRGGYTASQLFFTSRIDLDRFEGENRDRVLVFWEGTNEAASENPAACDATEAVTRRAVSHGWKVLLVTMIPRASLDGSGEAWRQTYNGCLRTQWSHWGASGLADVAARSTWATIDPTLYQTDKVHLTALGYYEIALAVNDELQNVWPTLRHP